MKDTIFEFKTVKHEGNYGQFELTPLPKGYGQTMGTALRRVLLSSLPGAAATSVKISGVKHQFSTLKGMKEDVLDFVLNLKRVRFTYDGDEPVEVSLDAKGPGEVKAGDIDTPSNVTVANEDLVLANLADDNAKLSAKITVESGVGYSPLEDRERAEIGVIPLDSAFSPIKRVNIKVEETRVGRVTNYDKLTLDVWSDGTIDPTDAVKEASRILISFFDQVVNPQEIEKEEEVEEDDGLGQVGRLSVEEIGLPTRVANALAKAGFDTVEKIANANQEDLVNVRNLGEKSVDIIKEALKEKGVEMGNA